MWEPSTPPPYTSWVYVRYVGLTSAHTAPSTVQVLHLPPASWSSSPPSSSLSPPPSPSPPSSTANPGPNSRMGYCDAKCSSQKISELSYSVIAVIVEIVAIAIDIISSCGHFQEQDVLMLFYSSKISKLNCNCYRWDYVATDISLPLISYCPVIMFEKSKTKTEIYLPKSSSKMKLTKPRRRKTVQCDLRKVFLMVKLMTIITTFSGFMLVIYRGWRKALNVI